MKNEFLTNLKNALDGNTDDMGAANRINEIVNRTKDMVTSMSDDEISNSFKTRIDNAGKRVVDEATAIKANEEYEKEVNRMKNVDILSNIIANTVNLESMVVESISDLLEHVEEVHDFLSENEEAYTNMKEYNVLIALLEKIENNYKQIKQ